MAADPNFTEVFVSHSATDVEAALAVANFVVTHLSVPSDEVICTSAAPYDLPTGDEYERAILKALTKCSVVVALVSPRSLASLFCSMEIGAAWGKRKRIIPIALPMLDINHIGRPLSSLNVTAWENQETWLHLLRTIEERSGVNRRQPKRWPQASLEMANRRLTTVNAVTA